MNNHLRYSIIAITLIFAGCQVNHTLVKGRAESVRNVQIYFLLLNSTPRIYTGISDLKKNGYILVNRNSDMLLATIKQLKSLKETRINIDDMDFQMLFIFQFSNGRKEEVAFDSKSRIYVNGRTCEKNPEIVKSLVNCLPGVFREAWLERKHHEF